MQPKMKYVGCLPWSLKKVEWILSHVKQRLVIHLLLILFIYEVFLYEYSHCFSIYLITFTLAHFVSLSFGKWARKSWIHQKMELSNLIWTLCVCRLFS